MYLCQYYVTVKGGLFFAFGAVDLAQEIIETVFEAVEGEIPGARIINLMSAEGLFVLSETVPGVVGVFRGSNAPEIENFRAVILGVDDHLDKNDCASHEFAVFLIGGGMGVVTNTVVIIDKGGSDGFAFELGDIEGSKTAFKLVFEVVLILGVEMIALAKIAEKLSKDGDLLGILGAAESDAFVLVGAPVAEFTFLNTRENLVLGNGEVDRPSMSGVEIVRFDEAVFGESFCTKRESGLNADKEGVLFVSEVFERRESLFKSGFGVLWVESRTIGAIEIVAERCGMFDGEQVVTITVEPECLMTFELRILFPCVRLK